MVVKLTPRAIPLDEKARRSNFKLELAIGRLAKASLASYEQLEVVGPGDGEIMKFDMNAIGAGKYATIALRNLRPSAPDATNGIVHAGVFAIRPISFKPA